MKQFNIFGEIEIIEDDPGKKAASPIKKDEPGPEEIEEGPEQLTIFDAGA